MHIDVSDIHVYLFTCDCTVSSIDSTTGSFTTGVTSVCHHITVLENNVVEPNGTIVVTIIDTSLEPSNTQLSTFRTDLIVVNDDSK